MFSTSSPCLESTIDKDGMICSRLNLPYDNSKIWESEPLFCGKSLNGHPSRLASRMLEGRSAVAAPDNSCKARLLGAERPRQGSSLGYRDRRTCSCCRSRMNCLPQPVGSEMWNRMPAMSVSTINSNAKTLPLLSDLGHSELIIIVLSSQSFSSSSCQGCSLARSILRHQMP